MTGEYKPPVANYFEALESRYGDNFNFDRLSDSELLELERLGRQAIEIDPLVTSAEKQMLAPLLTLMAKQKQKRNLS
ncbi:hypothetical protein [Thermithiobacillus plumbiphilus]|uniref:Uncharacterized protein n=1 Tax=Thermithiobacillus plumbiphilus TaxID=1729899 RepID=A0ABU9D7D7_9PROT